MNHENFCVFPFIQIVSRTNSSLGPCCNISNLANLQQTTLDEYWKGPAIDRVRTQMLHGNESIKECSICKHHENKFGSSMRTNALRDYGFNIPEKYEQKILNNQWKNLPTPNRLEIHVGNTCNLKCLTCNPRDSSMFLDEDRRLNISNYNQKDFTYSEDKIAEIFDFVENSEIDILDLRGGESMLIPAIKNRLLALPSRIYNYTTLRIQTNGTIYNQQWQSIFEKFKKLEIMVSVDGVGLVNEYVRFPSQWNIIEKNIDRFKSHNSSNLYINTVVSNINFLQLDELLAWSHEKNVYCHLSPLTHPKIFQFTNMPKDLLVRAKEKLKQFDYHPGVQSLLDTDAEFDCNTWYEFCSMIDRRDQYRQNRIFDVCPEMQCHWTTS